MPARIIPAYFSLKSFRLPTLNVVFFCSPVSSRYCLLGTEMKDLAFNLSWIMMQVKSILRRWRPGFSHFRDDGVCYSCRVIHRRFLNTKPFLETFSRDETIPRKDAIRRVETGWIPQPVERAGKYTYWEKRPSTAIIRRHFVGLVQKI